MKIMEKIVAFLSENNLFNHNQHGFMKGRSCLLALLSVYDEVILNLSNSQMSCTDTIYIDFAKAFDKVDHGVLLWKIYSRKQIYKNFLTKTIYNYIHVINKKKKK